MGNLLHISHPLAGRDEVQTIHDRTLRDTIAEIANEVRNRQIEYLVTSNDAVTHIDHDLVVAWATVETGKRSALNILTEALEKLTEAEAFSILTCLLNETDTARKMLANELRQHVARDLAYRAQCLIDDGPTDAEIDGPIRPNDIDDPLLAERRSFTRKHNASLRASRVTR